MSIFSFKQFTINQGKCAMKVCTDSCLFGAMVEVDDKVKYILDIGTGTGLLALMLAQKTAYCNIQAIEIEQNAANQAIENINNSPWKDRIKTLHISLQEFVNQSDNLFDLIICNPPFFEKNLKSENKKENLAKHNDSLTFEELITGVNVLMANEGVFWILLPPYEMEQFVRKANNNKLFLNKSIYISNRKQEKPFRIISKFQKISKPIPDNSIVIYNSDNTLTSDFIKFLKEYYLYL
ncbi:MAG: methyltransferase [Bacteroidota bacterium]|nr:methyltransferase [Bacteroidota bacterium]